MQQNDDLFSINDLPEPIDPRSLGYDGPSVRLTVGSTFVPGQRKSTGTGEVEIAVFPLTDGRTALFAYTSVPQLVRCLGPSQPWLEIKPIISASSLQLRAGADLMVWDQELPAELRHDEEDRER